MAKISYPQLGSYSVPVKFLLTHILTSEIIEPKKITSQTIELGSKYSPDFVCTPFKYTLGTMLESIASGADTLIQLGGGCRYGYYHELQREIIKGLGYKCEVINLVSGGKSVSLKRLFKRYNVKCSKLKLGYYGFITFKMVKYMDLIDDYIRLNRCYEKNKGEFNSLRSSMLKEFSKVTSYNKLLRIYFKYKKKFKNIELIKPLKPIRIGLIGELYTLMEPSANYNIEEKLNNMGIEVKRYTNATYLLFQKRKKVKKYLKNFFIKYRMGADALDNIYHTDYLCKHNYDGIIHIKASFCTPEIAAMPIISSVAKNYDKPVIFFSMDVNTSEVGIETRLEAFHDMLEMRYK